MYQTNAIPKEGRNNKHKSCRIRKSWHGKTDILHFSKFRKKIKWRIQIAAGEKERYVRVSPSISKSRRNDRSFPGVPLILPLANDLSFFTQVLLSIDGLVISFDKSSSPFNAFSMEADDVLPPMLFSFTSLKCFFCSTFRLDLI